MSQFGQTQKFALRECGHLYVTTNDDNVDFCEVFARLGPHGNCVNALLSTISTLTSLLLRAGVPPQINIQRLKAVRCPFPSLGKGGVITSCPDAISKAMEKHINKEIDKTNNKIVDDPIVEDKKVNGNDNEERIQSSPLISMCPKCGVPLRYESGCLSCPICRWSPKNCG